MSRIICYPLKKGGSKWRNLELRHSLRSVEAHFKGGYDEVVVLGTGLPSFLNPDTVRMESCPGYIQALDRAIEIAGPGGDILWMNDDIMILRDTDWQDLIRPVRRLGKVTRQAAEDYVTRGNSWRRRLGAMCLLLHEQGLPAWKFSTHTPYWYEADKLKQVLDRYRHLGYKVPIEVAYYNTFLAEFGHARERDKFRASGKKRRIGMNLGRYRFLNLTDGGLHHKQDGWMKGFIRGAFRHPSRFEKPSRHERSGS